MKAGLNTQEAFLLCEKLGTATFEELLESLVRLSFLFALFPIFGAGTCVYADTITTFNFHGASIFYGMAGDTNSVNGTTTIDTTTGQVQSITFLANGLAFADIAAQNGAEVFVNPSLSDLSAVGPFSAAFSFSAASLVGYTGSTFNLNGANDLYVGSLTAVPADLHGPLPLPEVPAAIAITPEPASLLLISTGLLGIALFLRRKPRVS